MADDKINITVSLSCKVCGGSGVTMPDDPSDDAVITCPSCGAELGARAQFDAHVRDGVATVAREQLKKVIKDALRGNPNIKLKL